MEINEIGEDMSTMPWFKMHSRSRTCQQLEALNGEQFRMWFKLLCLAGEQDVRGIIPYKSDLLLAVEVAKNDMQVYTDTMALLQAFDIIKVGNGIVEIINWKKYNERSPSETPEARAERQDKFRKARAEDAQKGVNVTPMSQLHNSDEPLTSADLDDVTVMSPLHVTKSADVTALDTKSLDTKNQEPKYSKEYIGASAESPLLSFQVEVPTVDKNAEIERMFNDDIWKTYRFKGDQRGNKAMAMKNYKAIMHKKERTHAEMVLLTQRYVAACNSTDTFLKTCEVWLNPTKKHWESHLPGFHGLDELKQATQGQGQGQYQAYALHPDAIQYTPLPEGYEEYQKELAAKRAAAAARVNHATR